MLAAVCVFIVLFLSSSPNLTLSSVNAILRLLEEGELIAAEKEKQRVESSQRERRKYREEHGITYEPMFFRYAAIRHPHPYAHHTTPLHLHPFYCFLNLFSSVLDLTQDIVEILHHLIVTPNLLRLLFHGIK